MSRPLLATKAHFRRKLLRVLNRGEAVTALKRSIYTGRVVRRRPFVERLSCDAAEAIGDSPEQFARSFIAAEQAR